MKCYYLNNNKRIVYSWNLILGYRYLLQVKEHKRWKTKAWSYPSVHEGESNIRESVVAYLEWKRDKYEAPKQKEPFWEYKELMTKKTTPKKKGKKK